MRDDAAGAVDRWLESGEGACPGYAGVRGECSGCGLAPPDCCDDDDECPDCKCNYCICDADDRDDPWDDLFDAPIYADRSFTAEYTRDMIGYGNLDAIARKQTRHGVPLGGWRWQRRANRTRAMQRQRKIDNAPCTFCGGRGCECPPF